MTLAHLGAPMYYHMIFFCIFSSIFIIKVIFQRPRSRSVFYLAKPHNFEVDMIMFFHIFGLAILYIGYIDAVFLEAGDLLHQIATRSCFFSDDNLESHAF
mgnify:CR=1 FL=1